jgi:hypothetical protein
MWTERKSSGDACGSAEAPLTALPRFDPGAFPRFNWGLGPYARASFFDPDRPVMVDIGLRLSAEWALSHRAILSGSVRKSLAGNFGESDRQSDSVLPKVRSEANRYLTEGDPALETLTFAYFFRPGRSLYGRLTLVISKRSMVVCRPNCSGSRWTGRSRSGPN